MPKGGTLPWFVRAARAAEERVWKGERGGEVESVGGRTEASERELVEGKMRGLRRNESQQSRDEMKM